MEMEVLQGAAQTIERCHPIMLIEKIKTDAAQLQQWLHAHGYLMIEAGINLVAIHSTDKTLADLAPAKQPAA
jgi:hypothetical protein